MENLDYMKKSREEIAKLIIEVCQKESTKNSPTMVAAVAELYRAYVTG